jgi:protein-L-isoaspartate(D-aspartate) O-methyltransferase
MVEEQIVRRGIHATRVLEAMREVPRHIFVPRKRRPWAYADGPLLLGHDQTISQPYIVALMTEALGLKGEERVLEIGTGSGYQTAILSRLAKQVYSVERIGELARRAREKLGKLGIRNVTVIVGNGSLGLPGETPFDAIIVTAAPPEIPEPLIEQLAEGGRLVLPVGEREAQELVKITKRGGVIDKESLGLCSFVPLIGREGWRDQ